MVPPLTLTVAAARTYAVPVWVELTTIVHWPLASVVAVVQVPPVTDAPAMLVGRRLPATVTPVAGVQPEPSFFSILTVNVCGSPTRLTPVVPMLIRASTHVFTLWTVVAP